MEMLANFGSEAHKQQPRFLRRTRVRKEDSVVLSYSQLEARALNSGKHACIRATGRN